MFRPRQMEGTDAESYRRTSESERDGTEKRPMDHLPLLWMGRGDRQHRQSSHLPPDRARLRDLSEPDAAGTLLGELRRAVDLALRTGGQPLHELPHLCQPPTRTLDALCAWRGRRCHPEPQRATDQTQHQDRRHGVGQRVFRIQQERPLHHLLYQCHYPRLPRHAQ